MWGRLWKDEGAQATAELALLFALITLAAVLALSQLGQKVNSAYENINNSLFGGNEDPEVLIQYDPGERR
ncbi:MAG TPA: hypothetical protein ENM97_02275 [Moorella mulderi]|nr:hypothetical protein [Moorella mulderi]